MRPHFHHLPSLDYFEGVLEGISASQIPSLFPLMIQNILKSKRFHFKLRCRKMSLPLVEFLF